MTNSNTTLAELRALNIEKQREERADAAQSSANENNISSHMTENMTNNITSQKTNKPENKQARKSGGNPAGLPSSKSEIQQVVLPASNQVVQDGDLSGSVPGGQSIVLSVRERLLAEATRQSVPQTVIKKTVTLKMDPTLDDRLNAYCYEAGKKKQDVIHDALMLYFETVGRL